ncbi:hypothetical protein DU002_16545 [Corallincola holothuriorum]|uniref:FUSC family protein n=1 Tax=Corallincola holothuriorum TaxID=2282215 RepID=A0A368N457_9GAMM|nr:FUSC family protein [Corallincola holothuriorum]RCU45322.1 hypothetical protein DU002_16545 [Corallincola holothuriorum]
MSLKSTERMQIPPLSAKAKHSIKFGLAMVISYFLALNFSWMSPTWAAVAVAMIALPTAGQSLAKGMLRAKGTFIAFAAGLFFLAMFPQDRWLLMIAVTPYLAFVTYKMTGKDGQYAWFVAGFVALMILTAGPGEPGHAFLFAAYRVLETLIGILIWTLISVFIWPVSNRNALHELSERLIESERMALDHYRAQLFGRETEQDAMVSFQSCETLIAQLKQTVDAAGAESYDVRMAKAEWQRLQLLSKSFVSMGRRFDGGIVDLHQVDVAKALPNIDVYLAEISAHLQLVGDFLRGDSVNLSDGVKPLVVEQSYIDGLNHFQRAAIAVAIKELSHCASIVSSIIDCVTNIKAYERGGEQQNRQGSENPVDKKIVPLGFALTPLDPDRIRYCFFTVVSLWVGFLIWIYIDPPGHVSWPYFLPNIALAAMQMPQMKFKQAKVWGIAYICLMPVYIFIMPELSQFWQLAILLFVLCALISYILPPLIAIAFYLGMFNMLGITNTQHYDVAAMMNTVVFTVTALVIIYGLSHIAGSPRPHKVCLKMLNRYFHSSGVVLASLAEPNAKRSFFARQRLAYHQQEVRTLPAKLIAWSPQIDGKQLSDDGRMKLPSLISTLEMMSLRIDDLYRLRQTVFAAPLAGAVNEEIAEWRRALARTFGHLAKGKALDSVDKISLLLQARLQRLDRCCETAINQCNRANDEELKHLYVVLGCYRNLSQVTLAYIGLSQQFDWQMLHEEHF